MRKFLPFVLCLSLSIFTVAAAIKPPHTPAANTKTAHKNPMGQEADAKTLLNDQNSNEGVASDDEDENMNDDDGGDAAGDEDTGDDAETGDEGGDDGGE